MDSNQALGFGTISYWRSRSCCFSRRWIGSCCPPLGHWSNSISTSWKRPTYKSTFCELMWRVLHWCCSVGRSWRGTFDQLHIYLRLFSHRKKSTANSCSQTRSYYAVETWHQNPTAETEKIPSFDHSFCAQFAGLRTSSSQFLVRSQNTPKYRQLMCLQWRSLATAVGYYQSDL